jgi:hypothetical protein
LHIPRQQKSFGRNPAKQCRQGAAAGLMKYLQQGRPKALRKPKAHKAGQLFPALVLPDLYPPNG